MTRTDVHSPTNLITEDYEYVAAFDTGASGWAISDWAIGIIRKVSATNADRGMQQCHHCGARIRYTAVLEHVPTGQFIAVGETCLENRFEVASVDFHRMRKAAELDRAAQRIKGLRAAFVAENPDMRWMDEAETPEPFASNSFLTDVARKFRTYGEISAAQYNAVSRVMVQAAERAARIAAEVDEVKVPVIEGKITITGEILSTKWQDSDYGATLKMLVKDDRGFKVWGSVPSVLGSPERGDTVSFSATVTKSDKDESFGFFKRPTKAKFTGEAAEREVRSHASFYEGD